MKDNGITISLMRAKLNKSIAKASHYSGIIFVILVVALYSILFFNIQSLGYNEPSDQAVDSQVKAAHVVRIDPSVVKQLQSLQDNSVSVQALFNQARLNPFQ